MKKQYFEKPLVFESLGKGVFAYRWNIKKKQERKLFSDEKRDVWICDEVTLNKLSPNTITEAVISELWDNNYEQKLVNEYNSAIMGLFDEDEATKKIESYKSFLVSRKEVKAQIDADCAEFGIK